MSNSRGHCMYICFTCAFSFVVVHLTDDLLLSYLMLMLSDGSDDPYRRPTNLFLRCFVNSLDQLGNFGCGVLRLCLGVINHAGNMGRRWHFFSNFACFCHADCYNTFRSRSALSLGSLRLWLCHYSSRWKSELSCCFNLLSSSNQLSSAHRALHWTSLKIAITCQWLNIDCSTCAFSGFTRCTRYTISWVRGSAHGIFRSQRY